MVAISNIKECSSKDILFIINQKCNIKMKTRENASVGIEAQKIFLFVYLFCFIKILNIYF